MAADYSEESPIGLAGFSGRFTRANQRQSSNRAPMSGSIRRPEGSRLKQVATKDSAELPRFGPSVTPNAHGDPQVGELRF
jgi:hypothetical protein